MEKVEKLKSATSETQSESADSAPIETEITAENIEKQLDVALGYVKKTGETAVSDVERGAQSVIDAGGSPEQIEQARQMAEQFGFIAKQEEAKALLELEKINKAEMENIERTVEKLIGLQGQKTFQEGSTEKMARFQELSGKLAEPGTHSEAEFNEARQLYGELYGEKKHVPKKAEPGSHNRFDKISGESLRQAREMAKKKTAEVEIKPATEKTAFIAEDSEAEAIDKSAEIPGKGRMLEFQRNMEKASEELEKLSADDSVSDEDLATANEKFETAREKHKTASEAYNLRKISHQALIALNRYNEAPDDQKEEAEKAYIEADKKLQEAFDRSEKKPGPVDGLNVGVGVDLSGKKSEESEEKKPGLTGRIIGKIGEGVKGFRKLDQEFTGAVLNLPGDIKKSLPNWAQKKIDSMIKQFDPDLMIKTAGTKIGISLINRFPVNLLRQWAGKSEMEANRRKAEYEMMDGAYKKKMDEIEAFKKKATGDRKEVKILNKMMDEAEEIRRNADSSRNKWEGARNKMSAKRGPLDFFESMADKLAGQNAEMIDKHLQPEKEAMAQLLDKRNKIDAEVTGYANKAELDNVSIAKYMADIASGELTEDEVNEVKQMISEQTEERNSYLKKIESFRDELNDINGDLANGDQVINAWQSRKNDLYRLTKQGRTELNIPKLGKEELNMIPTGHVSEYQTSLPSADISAVRIELESKPLGDFVKVWNEKLGKTQALDLKDFQELLPGTNTRTRLTPKNIGDVMEKMRQKKWVTLSKEELEAQVKKIFNKK